MPYTARLEDMSRLGRLQLTTDGDGDILVSIYPEDTYAKGQPRVGCQATVEFCIPGSGGGRSPRTHKALRPLMRAMAEDNADPACAVRQPEGEGRSDWLQPDAAAQDRPQPCHTGSDRRERWLLVEDGVPEIFFDGEDARLAWARASLFGEDVHLYRSALDEPL